MSKRVSNKPHGGGARSGKVKLGYWRLQRARNRQAAELLEVRLAEAEARKNFPIAERKKPGFLHSVVKSFNKLRKQSRRHA